MRATTFGSQIITGIFLCKDVNEQRLKTLVGNLLANGRVRRVVIRPHPKNLWRELDSWITSHQDERLTKSGEASAVEDTKGLDVVFGGNSSVLIDAVTAGVPSAYVDDLDHGSRDLHGLVAAGLMYRTTPDPDFDQLLRFYQQPEWKQRLRRFANIDDDEATVIKKTLQEISRLASLRAQRRDRIH